MLIALDAFQSAGTRQRLALREAAARAVAHPAVPLDEATRRADRATAVFDAADRMRRCERAILAFSAMLDQRPGFVRTDVQREMFDRLTRTYGAAVDAYRLLMREARFHREIAA